MESYRFILGLILFQTLSSSVLGWYQKQNQCRRCRGWFTWGQRCIRQNKGSCVTLPQYTPRKCQEYRQGNLTEQRKTYKLTKPPTDPDYSTVSDPHKLLTCPLLDLPTLEVLGLANGDPNQNLWLKLFIYINQRNENFTKLYQNNPRLYENISDYIDIYNEAAAFQVVNPATKKFFPLPSKEEPFKDIINSGKWMDDDVFTEQRLAGLNVHAIQKVTVGSRRRGINFWKLQRQLNIKSWNGAFSEVVGRRVNMLQMVRRGSVFTVTFPLLKNITNVPDLTKDPRVMRTSTSPIAIFVSLPKRWNKFWRAKKFWTGNELKPVGIQIDDKPNSPVYTPKDGRQWLMAKASFQLADFAYLEMVEHLLKAHYLLESICVTLRRTVSKFHPLMQIMEHHCVGVLAVNSVGTPKLLGVKGTMHTMFSIGNIGGIELVNRAYAQLSWNDMGFYEDLQKRGIPYSKFSKLPYYPYRDDGTVIFRFLKSFVNEYVNAYYSTLRDVRQDEELQNFANELSRDGGRDGGQGMLKGFPNRIWNKRHLKKTLNRILWVIMRHHTVNYPVNYYGSFVPNMPSKLYDARGVPDYEFSLKRFQTSPFVAFQVALGFSLATLRYDNLFDYSRKMKDELGQCIVQKYHDLLMSKIKSIIEERNKIRKAENHLTYPYLQPGYIPNSITT